MIDIIETSRLIHRETITTDLQPTTSEEREQLSSKESDYSS